MNILFENTTFLGIDPTAGQRPIVYAALDNELHLLALGAGALNDVLAFVAGLRQALVAVSAPRRPNTGALNDPAIRQRLVPPPRPGHWTNFRLAEYQVRIHNIHIPQTPAREEDCPGWMRTGFTLFRRMDELGYLSFPEEAERQYLEVYPHACYAVLLGRNPLPKYSLEGRLQRQLVLFEQNARVQDPMRFFEEITRHHLLHGSLPFDKLYSPQELDALVGAFTAWKAFHHPDQVSCLGDPAEGQLVLPAAELSARYPNP